MTSAELLQRSGLGWWQAPRARAAVSCPPRGGGPGSSKQLKGRLLLDGHFWDATKEAFELPSGATWWQLHASPQKGHLFAE